MTAEGLEWQNDWRFPEALGSRCKLEREGHRSRRDCGTF